MEHLSSLSAQVISGGYVSDSKSDTASPTSWPEEAPSSALTGTGEWAAQEEVWMPHLQMRNRIPQRSLAFPQATQQCKPGRSGTQV